MVTVTLSPCPEGVTVSGDLCITTFAEERCLNRKWLLQDGFSVFTKRENVDVCFAYEVVNRDTNITTRKIDETESELSNLVFREDLQ